VLTGGPIGASAGSWTTSGFSAGLLINNTNPAHEPRGSLYCLSVAPNY
jgi:hypothetical protein